MGEFIHSEDSFSQASPPVFIAYLLLALAWIAKSEPVSTGKNIGATRSQSDVDSLIPQQNWQVMPIGKYSTRIFAGFVTAI